MELKKLFRLLVVGGAVLGGAPACGPQGPDESPSGTTKDSNAQTSPDAGQPSSGGGGGVDFW